MNEADGGGVNITLRLPNREVHDALKRLANDEGRSLNSEIVVALRKWIANKTPKRVTPRSPRHVEKG